MGGMLKTALTLFFGLLLSVLRYDYAYRYLNGVYLADLGMRWLIALIVAAAVFCLWIVREWGEPVEKNKES